MTEIQEIDVFVKPDGTVQVEVRGVKGPKCLALTEELENLLGASITERLYSDEFDMTEQEALEAETVSLDNPR